MRGVYLLLGSNLQDREGLLKQAVEEIEISVGKVLKASSVYESEAWGVTDQPAFLNQVLEVETALEAYPLLMAIQQIEIKLGRVRHERWGERTMDIDILFFGEEVLQSQRLTVPHPELHNRRFTLLPLIEVVKNKQHPTLGYTLEHLLEQCPDKLKAWVYKPEMK
ncbi:2-amino-4-hydroxy-6-hydroxymethyldihydropteridine diphosphokinase [Persicobacter psychrovividus]|uniref:2-amino-4-hydroxy-6-hydroxymethyldihydropteridine pyrophosphokinase n=1 Tax=Persicobacter psychrovividus TaxID=387638 RepID=A0ABM7VE36_9BACT|nr:2-amino-4-hydroxy-6-hydroxymethyldihydropteridine diphosphokinase [Persicobacter psychrovividus]